MPSAAACAPSADSPCRRAHPSPRNSSKKRFTGAGSTFSALIASLSHILLDWTNNYGVRPFFPFNPRWYAGSFVFIADPILWALLLAAVLIPWILSLADNEIGARRTPFRGRSWAIFALCGMVLVWALRLSQQFQARALLENVQITTQPATRIAIEPYPFSPFHWHAILETPSAFQTAEVDTRSGQIDSDPATNAFFKPPVTPAVEAAKQTELGRVYLDLGRPGRSSAISTPAHPLPRRAATPRRPHLDHSRILRPSV